MQYQAVIYWAKQEGLANRLRALVGYQALSQHLGLPFYVCWEPQVDCQAKFTDLFELGGLQLINKKEKNRMLKQQQVYLFQRNDWFSEIWKQKIKNQVSWDDYIATVIQSTQNIKPLASIQEKVWKFSQDHHLANAIGIHVRLTDNVKTYDRWSKSIKDFSLEKTSGIEGFEKFIADQLAEEPQIKFFLATDNCHVEERLTHLFGSSVITYPKRYVKPKIPTIRVNSYRKMQFELIFNRPSSIDEALIEMLLLGQCKLIVGTYFSSFSKFSAFRRNVPYLEIQNSTWSNHELIEKIRIHPDAKKLSEIPI